MTNIMTIETANLKGVLSVSIWTLLKPKLNELIQKKTLTKFV